MVSFSGSDIAAIAVALIGSWATILAPLLARDWVRDKRFQAIREQQGEKFTCRFSTGDQTFSDRFACQFSSERARHLSEIRDDVRDLHRDSEKPTTED